MNSRKANIFVGLILAGGIAYYLFNFGQQTKGVVEICSIYSEGSSISGIQDKANSLPVKLRGPHILKDESQQYIVCSEYSMCDISCDIKVENGIVKEMVLHNVST